MGFTMNRLLKLSLLILVIIANGVEGVSLANAKPSAEKDKSQGSVKYQDYIKHDMFELDNGLRVIVHEDKTAPIVSYLLSFHVGSKDEPQGKTGFAHLFEHLLFAGTKTNPGEYFGYVAELGGTNLNASTGNDFTSYFATVPSGAFERVMWIEGDRMANTIYSIDEKYLATQIDVVKNEKSLSANQPFGDSVKDTLKAIYPAGHPYAHEIIGSTEDIEAASMDDVRSWYEQYYGARNIVLSISGDIDLPTAKTIVTKYFGSLRSGPSIYKQTAKPVKRLINTQQKNYDVAQSSSVRRTYVLPKVIDQNSYMPLVAADIIAAGSESRLSKALVDEQEIAISVDGAGAIAELGSEYVIEAVPAEGVSLEQLSDALDVEIAKAIDKGFKRSDLQIKYGPAKSALLGTLTNTLDKAFMLGEGLQGANDPLYELRKLEWIETASPGELKSAAQDWLMVGFHEEHNIALKEAEQNQQPTSVGPPPPIASDIETSIPAPETFTLNNGLDVVLLTRKVTPSIAMSYQVAAGTAYQNADTRELPTIMGDILNNSGLARMSSDKQAELIAKLGVDIGMNVGERYTNLELNADKDSFPKALDVWTDMLSKAQFEQDDVDRYAKQNIQFERIAEEDIQYVRLLVQRQAIWGDEYTITPQEKIQYLETLTSEQLNQYYRKWFRPKGAKLYIVGDIERSEIEPLLNKKLKNWVGTVPKSQIISLNFSPKSNKSKFIIIDDKGSDQTDILAVSRLDMHERDMYRENVMNSAFGGSFTSRLNLNIREDKGWTYGISSFFENSPSRAYFAIDTAVTAENTLDSIQEIITEIREARTTRPITSSEIEKIINEEVKVFSSALVTNSDFMSVYMNSDYYGKDYTYYNDYKDRILAIDAESTNKSLKELIDSNGMVWALTGDAELIEADIRAANLGEVEVYNRNGKRLR